MSTSFPRHLPLEGSYNIRDIGGYLTLDGRQTRWHTIIRADRPAALTSASQEALLDYGVRTIIDLRFPKELAKNPNLFANSSAVNYLNLALFTDEAAVKVDLVDTLLAQNIFSLDACQSQMRAIFEAIATQPPAIMVHCTIGKDRTGLVIALLLSLVKVPAATIAEDYALSALYLEPIFEKMRQRVKKNGQDLARYEPKLTALPATMLDTLAYLDEHYGGAAGYLQTIGLTTAQLDYLQTLLVE